MTKLYSYTQDKTQSQFIRLKELRLLENDLSS